MIPRATRHLTLERVQDIVDGETPWLDEVVHLMWCARCADELQGYQHIVQLVRELARAPMSSSLSSSSSLPSMQKPWRWSSWRALFRRRITG